MCSQRRSERERRPLTVSPSTGSGQAETHDSPIGPTLRLHRVRWPVLPRIVLSPEHIDCVLLDAGAQPGAVCGAIRQRVSPQEWQQAQRYRQPDDAARHLLGRALLRQVLGDHLGRSPWLTDFARNPWGKPLLPHDVPGAAVHFNLSHSGRWVVAAFSLMGTPGVDVERLASVAGAAHASVSTELAGQLHPAEAAEVLAAPPEARDRAFLRCWVRKEAVLKALGEGLSRPLASFRVRCSSAPDDWLLQAPADAPLARWQCRDVAVDAGHACSLAWLAP